MSGTRRIVLTVVVALAALVVAATPAAAQDSAYEEAAISLRAAPVYVSPAAETEIAELTGGDVLTPTEQADLVDRARVSEVPVWIAVLPQRTQVENAAGRLYEANGRQPGAYVVVWPDSSSDVGAAGIEGLTGADVDAARDDARAAANRDLYIFLGELIDGVGRAAVDPDAAINEGEAASDGGGFGTLPTLLLLGAGGLAVASMVRRRKGRAVPEASVADVRRAVDEDVTAFGERLDALEIDVRDPATPEDSRTDLLAALDDYERAKEAAALIRVPEDAARVAEALEDGRWRLARIEARREGREPPERRAPCFFDPGHGPSDGDAVWTPPGGTPREVPVCASCFARLARGEEPPVRTVPVGAERRPYYDAGAAYGPWAGGYFGGALPGILVGTLLGSMWATPAWGTGWHETGMDDAGGFDGGGFSGGGGFDGGGFSGGGFDGGGFDGGGFDS